VATTELVSEHPKHPNVNLLFLYSSGMVSEKKYAEIEKHLEECRECLPIKIGLKNAIREWEASGRTKDLSCLLFNFYAEFKESVRKSK